MPPTMTAVCDGNDTAFELNVETIIVTDAAPQLPGSDDCCTSTRPSSCVSSAE